MNEKPLLALDATQGEKSPVSKTESLGWSPSLASRKIEVLAYYVFNLSIFSLMGKI